MLDEPDRIGKEIDRLDEDEGINQDAISDRRWCDITRGRMTMPRQRKRLFVSLEPCAQQSRPAWRGVKWLGQDHAAVATPLQVCRACPKMPGHFGTRDP